MQQYQPRNQNRTIIGRMNLWMALGAKYQHLGANPFIFKKDGKQFYNVTRDLIEFTCCPISEHVHTMTPLQMLKLPQLYPSVPCPYCNQKGELNLPPDRGIFGESGDESFLMFKKYGGNNLDMNNMSAVKEVVKKIAEDQRSEEQKHENRYTSDMAASSSLESYMARHPEYKPRPVVDENGNEVSLGENKKKAPFNKYGDHAGPPPSGPDSLEMEMSENPMNPNPPPTTSEAELSSEDLALLDEVNGLAAGSVQNMQRNLAVPQNTPQVVPQTEKVKPKIENILSDAEDNNVIKPNNTTRNQTIYNDEEEEMDLFKLSKIGQNS